MAHSVQKVVERCEQASGGEDGEGEGKGQLGKSSPIATGGVVS